MPNLKKKLIKLGWLAFFLSITCLIVGLSLWPFWAGTVGANAIEKRRDAPFLRPDPLLLDRFFAEVVDEEGFVDYERAQRAEVRQLLDAYLVQVSKATPAQFENDAQRLAFYINAYNALTIEGVLFYWPINSVKEVGYASLFFRERRYQIAGRKVSLHGFEIEVIKKYSALHHFGLNCASYSCPPLRRRAYRAENLEDELQQQAYNFLTNRNHNAFDYYAQTWFLSSIFDWYQADFGGKTGVVAFVHQRLPAISKPEKVRYLPYDWRLNQSQP